METSAPQSHCRSQRVRPTNRGRRMGPLAPATRRSHVFERCRQGSSPVRSNVESNTTNQQGSEVRRRIFVVPSTTQNIILDVGHQGRPRGIQRFSK